MDIVLNTYDRWVFTPYVYPKDGWPEDNIVRQLITLTILVNIQAAMLYFAVAGFSYVFLFNKKQMEHPLFLKNQIRQEITVTLKNIPMMSFPTIIVFLIELHGYSKLYDSSQHSYGIIPLIKEVFSFLFFTDMLIYFIHRGLHHPLVYKRVHKLHHRWIVPTPFASHAFQWLDGFLQSTPYHIYVFLFPLHKVTYLSFFIFVNFWTVSIHDGNYAVPKLFRSIVNGAAHHNDHHQYYNCNYGQFFTFWDRLMCSFRSPAVYNEQTKHGD
ncbi:unnamed protein product [Rotaria socialis]|uniref:Fatty acid hydroxylase domain-containing protein n=1 Tax=Rotaria socialis TaxID=392032 RepID=A0A820ZAD4_9BILA|nr:unnamed protein product [Rotaria socialis]CAF4208266.1 unnamed protein product [Rotaria socialis]CAF4372533.1 unnamed protein product [Rotaria socialis]CAF4558898.1 unnamed protein product [Rotaria socialis]CAF4677783.1 unnamed protein product [Rotaria socialis]